MTTLYIPTGAALEIETADTSRLAFEYRNCRDAQTLNAIFAELEKRDAQARQLAALVAACNEAVNWLTSDGVKDRLKGTWPMADERRALVERLGKALDAVEAKP